MSCRLMKQLVLVALICCCAWPVLSDHAPEWLVSLAEPETTLARIVVGETTVAQAEKLYGPADASKVVAEDGTETEYVWHLPLSELQATTIHPRNEAAGTQTIYAVEVRQRQGRRSNARTGAGVAIGADLDALIRAYGPRYMTSWSKGLGESGTVSFVFNNETELSAGFSDAGTITSLLLVESQE